MVFQWLSFLIELWGLLWSCRNWMQAVVVGVSVAIEVGAIMVMQKLDLMTTGLITVCSCHGLPRKCSYYMVMTTL
jgi:hypothetical protein